MKRFFSLFVMLLIIMTVTSCALFQDYNPSYFSTLKSNESKIGNVVQVLDKKSSARYVVTSDNLDNGEYENNGEYFTIEDMKASFSFAGDKMISQLVEYNTLSDYAKSIIGNDDYKLHEDVCLYAHHSATDVLTSDDVNEDNLYIEVNVLLKDNVAQYCAVFVYSGTSFKKWLSDKEYNTENKIYTEQTATAEEFGDTYLFNADMSNACTKKEVYSLRGIYEGYDE